MDRQAHASRFVIQTGLATHRRNFHHPDITYLINPATIYIVFRATKQR